MPDIVRVLRLIEYVGPREQVEKQISKSVHGSRSGITGVVITAQTLGEFPDLLDSQSALAVALQQVEALRQAVESDREKYEYRLTQLENSDKSYNAQDHPRRDYMFEDNQ